MNLFRSSVTLAVVVFAAASAFAQGPAKPVFEASYNVSLQMVVASNEYAGSSALPAELNSLTKQFRSSFGYSNYRLVATFLGRIADRGNFSHKSMYDPPEPRLGAPTFIEWTVTDLSRVPTDKGTNGISASSIRFGARVPISASRSGEDGKTVSFYNYEQLGITLERFGLAENTPTLLGSLNLPGSSGTMFLVMTVRFAD